MPVLMFIAEFIFEMLFFVVCGWVGHAVVKVVTFGKVDLDWGPGSKAVVTECLGLFLVLFTGACVMWLWEG